MVYGTSNELMLELGRGAKIYLQQQSKPNNGIKSLAFISSAQVRLSLAVGISRRCSSYLVGLAERKRKFNTELSITINKFALYHRPLLLRQLHSRLLIILPLTRDFSCRLLFPH